jgi:energy coupling factor transporter S component ThiW
LEKPREFSISQKNLALKVAMVALFTALGVVLSYFNPFAYIPILTIKPNPFAHIINVIVGVYLGPVYAILTAFFIAIIRFSVGWGSHYAFPGGMSGALVVGIFVLIFRRIDNKYRIYAALTEPIGTVFIGGTISSFWSISLSVSQPLVYNFVSLLTMWLIFAVSCVTGTIIGFLILIILEKKANITYLNFK